MKIDDLQLWEAYVAVAKQGNFAKAAKALKTPVSQISKRVSRLEDLLGARLFTRSTRVVQLTAEGQGLVERAVTLLEDAQGLAATFEDKTELAGTLRMTCASYVAHRMLPPVLRDFRDRHPKVEVEVDMSETFHDLIESRFDLAIRIDTPDNTSAIYRKLFANELVFCASPDYLASAPPIRAPKDLEKHSILMMNVIHRHATFRKSGLAVRDMQLKRHFQSEEGMLLAEFARQGMGVLCRGVWDVRPDLTSGRLVQVLPNHPLENFGHGYAVIPSRKYLAPRVRAFMDLILEHSKNWQDPWNF